MTTRIDTMPLPIRRGAGSPRLRLAMAFLTCVMLTGSLVGDSGLAERKRAEGEYARTVHDVIAIRNENAGLREQVRRLQTDRLTIEGVARQDLGLIRPDEILFLLPPPR